MKTTIARELKRNMDLAAEIKKGIPTPSDAEAAAAHRLIKTLTPCLKKKRDNGRYDTEGGDKTALGLYRTIRGMIEEDIRLEGGPKELTWEPMRYDGVFSRYVLKAEKLNNDDLYHEMAVSYHDLKGERVADVYFTVDRLTGDPKVLVTTGGDGDGDHQLIIYPLKPASEAVTEDK